MFRFIALAATPLLAVAAQPSVTTSSGPVTGLTDGRADKFLGIPFAQSPPVRFGAPVPATAWSSPLNATEVRASCIQQFVDPPRAREFVTNVYNNPAPPESEDCLYLNVWAPANATNKPEGGWPVLFWIYGGDLQFGSAGLPEYDGSVLAGERDVVVVTSNYRTNGEYGRIHTRIPVLMSRQYSGSLMHHLCRPARVIPVSWISEQP